MNNASLLAAIQKKKTSGLVLQGSSPTTPKPKEDLAFRQDPSVPFEFRNEAFLFFGKDDAATDFIANVVDSRVVIPLAPCIYRLCDYTLSKREPVQLGRVISKLGVLRCLQREGACLNEYLKHEESIDETKLAKTRFLELLSNCGVYQSVLDSIILHSASTKVTVVVKSLEEFLLAVEENTPTLKESRSLIETTGTTKFYPGLGELFLPGTKIVCFPGSLYGSPLGSTVVQSWYNEEKNMATNKTKRSFVLVIEFVVSVGKKLVTVAATDVYPEFPNTTSLNQLHHKCIDEVKDALLLRRLELRGAFYASVATSPTYIHYSNASFYPNRASRPLSKSGRVMVDVQRGIANSVLPVVATSSDNSLADTVKEAIKVWESHVRTGIHVPFRNSEKETYWQCWPVLTGFSFTARQWGKIVLELPPINMIEGASALSGNCQYIEFQQKAFEQLVLEEDKKELIRAVARNAGLADAIDVVADKGGASIFLLHGPPGCGKTLTAEAIAELLHKPLYIVTAGDLGITAAEVEKTFGEILELCQQWNALLLIDEADVFLEARTSLEIQRNALVCVMLRLLEYYSGCLFLSSNRSADNIDQAIASRITVMLDYPALSAEGRSTVWRNLLALVPNNKTSEACYESLGQRYKLNGRQIKNSIVLARALAKERDNADVTIELLERAVIAVAGPSQH